MAINIQTTQEIIDGFLSNFQNRLNQTIPSLAKAFVRVLSTNMGLTFTSLYKYGVERSLQNLALTATGEDLDRIGQNYRVFRTAAESTVVEAELFIGLGETVGPQIDFVANTNRRRYRPTSTFAGTGATSPPDTIRISDTSPGADGVLQVGDTLSISITLANVGSTAVVTSVVNAGADRESDEDYRRRVLNEIRTVGGGGNAVDYRTWAEEVAGVLRAFPYSGAPLTALATLQDGDMEAADTSAWSSGHSALLGKVSTGAAEGTRFLQIVWNSQDDPYAFQTDIFTIGQRYIIRGWGRGDGTVIPSIQDPIGTDIWVGNSSLNWEEFEFEHTAQSTNLNLVANTTVFGGVGFDGISINQVSLSGDRTVYIEVDSSIDPDGIPPQSILDEVRDTINYDPDTGRSRPPLGETDQTLFVEPISRTEFFVRISGLDVPSDQEVAAKAGIEADLGTFFRDAIPFVVGLDFEADRTDYITNLTVARTVQDILFIYGGSASTVIFGLTPGNDLRFYQLSQGELAKLGGVDYV